MADIFLSYNREDQARARLFAEAFEAEGLSVWWDVTLRSGEAYDEVTEAALRGAKAVVVLWSPRSVVSRWVRAEATVADRCRTLIPAMIEPCERPIMFELTQTAELCHWHGERVDPEWLKFVSHVWDLIERNAATSRDTPTQAQAANLSPVLAATATVQAAKPAKGKRPTLGVLPFTNRSGQAVDDWFGEAMAEDISTALTHLRGLRVIAHGLLAGYAGQVIDIRRIGAELGIDYIMEGNVRALGDTLRVTAQLVECRSGTILWNQKFDRPASEQAELLDELVSDVSTQLGIKIQNIEFERAVKAADPASPWDAVKRCWALIPRFSEEGLLEAVASARKAIAMAPDYALAYSSLAIAQGVLYQLYGYQPRELIDEALGHCARAIELDANHPTVHLHVARVTGYAQRWADSLVHAQRSVDLNPHMPDAHQALSGALIHFERYDEAIAHMEESDRISPKGYSLTISLRERCLLHLAAEQWDLAARFARELAEASPADRYGLMTRAMLAVQRGDLADAAQMIAELRRVAGDVPYESWQVTILNWCQSPAASERSAKLFEQAWNAWSSAHADESEVPSLTG